MITMHLRISDARDGANSGLWLALLVPIGLLRTGHQALAADILVTMTVLFSLCVKTGSALVFTCGVGVSFLTFSFNPTVPFRQIFVLGFVICCTRNLLRLFPKSFTVGEALLLTHLLIVFLHSYPLFLIVFICSFLVEYYSIPCTPLHMIGLLCFVAVLSFTVTWLILPGFPFFYVFRIKQLWCFFTPSHVALLSSWAFLLLLSVAITIFYHRCGRLDFPVDTSDHCTSPPASLCPTEIDPPSFFPSTKQSNCINSKPTPDHCTYLRMKNRSSHTPPTPFWLRKVFHFNAGLVFALGLQFAPRLLSSCAACLLIAFGLFEWIRRRGPAPVAICFSNLVNPFRDERDSGALVFTPIALLLGLAIPVWWPDPVQPQLTVNIGRLCPNLKVSPSMWAGVLSISVGDSMAALFGRPWGRTRWPYSHRTFVGSFASLVSQYVCWLLIAHLHSWPVKSGLVPIVLGVLVEAYTEQIDNLVVPLVVMSAFA
ncbi:Dolichol kinase [Clonorchis sinensis]|uniref:Dolichol kinase n=2 Tax=Clonorchis sinensis TaxID=79923 RepID=A0A8T1MAY1_CLOSI|nr:Dolichol kinase [Clonorchis sinensis]GAA48993.1 dolichol kinase [Clonorchis sinensis]